MTQHIQSDDRPCRQETGARDPVDERLEGLISASAQGVESAFEQLYRSTSAQLYGVLLRILRTEALAQEALQETYIRIWHNAERYRSDRSSPRTWLVSIARNHAIDVLRKRSNREDVELILDKSSLEDMSDRKASLETRHESGQLLAFCLEQLTEPARECVVGAYCEGYSQEELSDRLQRPIGTVKSWIRRSLISLKDCLDGFK